MKRNIAFLIFSVVSINLFSQSSSFQISSSKLKKYVKYLASDKLEGRGTGTQGEEKAALYIATQLKKLKELKPKGTNSYFQDFYFRENINPHDTLREKTIERKGKNILAYLDNGAENTIVIGAHYDHLGLGQDHNSLEANPEGKIHNGADDNASGAAGVIELANYFSSNNKKEIFNILFCWFSGEELGLIGSKKFCENSTIDLKKVNYMINLDMIGRFNDTTKKLLVYGVGTSATWVPLLDSLQDDFSFKYDSAGIGPSDQTSFYLIDLPVLFFFTGQHSDYHKASDDWKKINYKGEKKVLELVLKVVEQTEKIPKLIYSKTKSSEIKNTRFKVTMGIMPDYVYDGKGLRVDGVSEGKPAYLAGVQKGDIIVQLGEYSINSMNDYMNALNKMEKGVSVPLQVLRKNLITMLSVKF